MDEVENTEATAAMPVQSPRQRLLSEIGQKLLLARETRGEQLSIVVRKLKLREFHLQALESGNWDCLPDDVYALGFLRQYANYLALDLEDEIRRIKNDEYILTRPLTFPDPPVAPSYKWAWIAGTAFVILFVTFNILNQDTVRDMLTTATSDSLKTEQTTPASENVPPAGNVSTEDNSTSDNLEKTVTAQIQKTGNISILSTSEAPTEVKPTAASHLLPVPEIPAKAALARASPEQISIKPTADKTSTSSNTKESTAELASATAQPAIIDLIANPALPAKSGEAASPTNNKPATVHYYLFEAVTASVWLQIFLPDETGEAKGKLYREVLLQKGQHSGIKEAVDSLWITSGNPAAMRIKVDGQIQAEVGSLGKIGRVLRNYHFKVARQGSN
jgi:hypothetical protein